MPLSDAAMVLGANAIRSALQGMQLHTADPGIGGAANRSSAAPQSPTWTLPAADGDFSLAAPVVFTGGTPNGPVTHLSLWSSTNLSTAIWYGNFPLSGDLTFDGNGNYTVEAFTVNGSAT
ncbi:hypothetical protein [Mycobacterium heckeshornense]|uniref:hypothetical protein n=1 Tax=Mycobacterium heckeshornense TaxID=110505 RepID=UPI000AB24D1E|nr:hypothetical protein [Mycobacterium heckeshornense]